MPLLDHNPLVFVNRTLRGVTGASQLPDWIPASFVICPKEESQVKGQIDQLTALKRKARRRKDEREHFIQAFEEIKDGEGGSAWIAKSSTGAKGRCCQVILIHFIK